jgi:hypothetical protein
VLALEQHLAQYGYQQPANAVLEPESLQSCMQDNTDGKLSPALAAEIIACSVMQASLLGFCAAAVCTDSHHAIGQ